MQTGAGHDAREFSPHGQSRDMEVSYELVRLDPGLFSLSLGTGPYSGKQGLPAARVSLPPGPGDPRQTVSVSTFRGDGWLTADDEPALVRVTSGSSEVLVTLYWNSAHGAGPKPRSALDAARHPGQGITGDRHGRAGVGCSGRQCGDHGAYPGSRRRGGQAWGVDRSASERSLDRRIPCRARARCGDDEIQIPSSPGTRLAVAVAERWQLLWQPRAGTPAPGFLPPIARCRGCQIRL